MDTIIIPGFSIKNKDWAEETKNNLTAPSTIIYWPHWQTEKTESDWIKKEALKIQEKYGDGPINIIAKSIGTVVTMTILNQKAPKINKLILCGICLTDFLPGDAKRFDILKNFSTENLLCIQNENDNHGSFTEAKKLVHSINPEIKIISKPRDDHNYPYSEDFNSFLK